VDPAKTGAHALRARLRPVPRPRPIRVFLVDAHSLMRQGLKMILASEGDIEIVGEADSGRLAMTAVAALEPDVVLMDIVMPGGDGIEAIRTIKLRCPGVQILVLTVQSNQELFHEAAEAGAVGYVLKDISPANLSNAIRAVHGGATMINPVLARQMVEGFSRDGGRLSPKGGRRVQRLTHREIEILIEVARGLSDKEIAVKLILSESRVKNCLRALYGRLTLRNRAHAAAFAVRRGLL